MEMNHNRQYRLAPAHRGHLQTLHEWDRLEQDRELYTCRPLKPLPDLEDYINSQQRKIAHQEIMLYVLVRKDRDDSPLGRVRLFDINTRNRSAEFGYYLPPPFRGRGLGGIMLTLFLDHVFTFTDLNKLYATTSSGNRRSVRLLERLGFRLDGRLREHYWIGTERFDQLNYSILRREWPGECPKGDQVTHDNTAGVTVVPAGIGDVERLALMNRFLIEDEGSRNPMSTDQLCQRVELWLQDKYQAVLICRDETVVGYCLYEEGRDDHQERTVIYIRQFFIERDQRGRGLGRTAFNILAREAFPRGCRVTTDVLATNPDGQAFWRNLGFEPHYLNLKKE